MKIKLINTVAGPTFAASAGSVVEVDEEFGKALCSAGAAQPLSPPVKEEIEIATVAPVETAVTKLKRKR